MEIPRYGPRLECFIFKQRFEKDVEELQRSLGAVRDATKQVLTSSKLQRILEAAPFSRLHHHQPPRERNNNNNNKEKIEKKSMFSTAASR